VSMTWAWSVLIAPTLLATACDGLQVASRTSSSAALGRRRAIAGAGACTLALFAPELAGALETQSQLENAILVDEQQIRKEKQLLGKDEAELRKDKKLIRSIEADLFQNRKLVAIAKEAGDTDAIPELESKIEALLAQEAKMLREEASLVDEIKKVSAEEFKEEQKLNSEKNSLASMMGEDGTVLTVDY